MWYGSVQRYLNNTIGDIEYLRLTGLPIYVIWDHYCGSDYPPRYQDGPLRCCDVGITDLAWIQLSNSRGYLRLFRFNRERISLLSKPILQ